MMMMMMWAVFVGCARAPELLLQGFVSIASALTHFSGNTVDFLMPDNACIPLAFTP